MPSQQERAQRKAVIDNLLHTPIVKPAICNGCVWYQGSVYGGVILNCEHYHNPGDVPKNCSHRVA